MARRLQLALNALIVLSTVCFVTESYPRYSEWEGWLVFESVIAGVFTVEYALRIYVAPDGRGDESETPLQPFASRCDARLSCVREPIVIIDLVALLPFWLELFLPFMPISFVQVVRALRLVRVFRTLRLAQESRELVALAACVRRVIPALRLLLFFLALELVVVGGLVFHAEKGDLNGGTEWLNADGTPSTFQNIPEAAWYTLVTVTTVGYGDMVPATFLGRAVAGAAMLTGVVGLSTIISIVGAEMARPPVEEPAAGALSQLPQPLCSHNANTFERTNHGAAASTSTSGTNPSTATNAAVDAIKALGSADYASDATDNSAIMKRLDRIEAMLAQLAQQATPRS